MNSSPTSLGDVADQPPDLRRETVLGYPRDFLGNQFVYLVVSPRAGGLCIGLNLNPDQQCNFDCIYCDVVRKTPASNMRLNVERLAAEFRTTLEFVHSGKVMELPSFRNIPRELLTLRQVTLSGDGEPTLCNEFREVIEDLVHFRAMSGQPFFKLVLLTNATGLDRETVKAGLKHFNRQDEIWCKLDGGTPEHLQKVNRPQVPPEHVFSNILALARERPVVIQSLFPAVNGAGPFWHDVEAYAARLKQLLADGAKISLVQIYSAAPTAHHDECGHVPLRTLSKIAQHVRQRTGLRTEVF